MIKIGYEYDKVGQERGDATVDTFKITKPVRLIELFSGIGAQAMAMKRLQVPFESWKTSDWEVDSVKSYKAIHFGDDNLDYSKGLNKEELVDALCDLCISTDGKQPMTKEQINRKGEKWLRETYNNFKATRNLGSITNIHAEDLEIDEENYTTMLFYSFPCQALSLAGKQEGMDEGSGTSSSLIWEVKRILLECKELNCLPTVCIMENVSAIHNKKNMPNFQKWLDFLESLNYKSYWQDLNSKDYGVAQNRQRTFCVSLLSDLPYVFPEPIELKKRLKDYLEPTVEEKYYIQNEKAQKLIVSLIERGVLPPAGGSTTAYANYRTVDKTNVDIAKTLCARNMGHYE